MNSVSNATNTDPHSCRVISENALSISTGLRAFHHEYALADLLCRSLNFFPSAWNSQWVGGICQDGDLGVLGVTPASSSKRLGLISPVRLAIR
jgi:hypothetical protein